VIEHYIGSLRLAGHVTPIHVAIDLTDDHHMRITTDDLEIGAWKMGEVSVRAAGDGFHFIADGEELIVTTDDDPGFAIAMGVRNAPPLLRKQISERLRYDPQYHHEELEVEQ
jgi:hypothetical protein